MRINAFDPPGNSSGPPRIRPPPAVTRFAAASMSPTQRVAHGGIANRIEECGGRRCRDAPRPAGVGSCDGDVTLPGAVGRVTAVDCESGSPAAGDLMRRRSASRPEAAGSSAARSSCQADQKRRSAWCGISRWREKTLFRRYLSFLMALKCPGRFHCKPSKPGTSD
jgi:hypothetical protein